VVTCSVTLADFKYIISWVLYIRVCPGKAFSRRTAHGRNVDFYPRYLYCMLVLCLDSRRADDV